ncbi:MAG: shikimate dehydrogenase [Candidatus Magasanikbacteria bacterium CG_4_10_14_0_2_um_filter_37_12]|uniref:Shikimate dehydrogenase (NADP(+)) n=1 Tax=Candidatus Magasanikbacteria bacterium CG_4_10_14_0_2_um_filter_37_12 TaxID=1974637 RepID=A0A2M7V6T5_9BACT|nr:MAG: shikimate dehydrogenase [Candidatus Magasanikbacteria bacterium CG_4_10_14_0_2_um_filter_37_12]
MNAVIGNPLEHSLSPILHNEMYRLLNIEAEFIKDEDENIYNLVERIKNKPYELTAVTMPHKQLIINLLDEIDSGVKKIGAVNTVINKNGILIGYNTDMYGIEYALRNSNVENKKILIVGAGASARTVAFVIKKMNGNILWTNRNQEKAKILAQEFGGRVVELENIQPEQVDVVINTTPVGMYPDVEKSPVPKEFLQSHHAVFDIVYNPLETKFLADARETGAQVISGIDMFIAQGMQQIELWQGIKINIDGYYSNLKTVLFEHLNI